MDSFNILQPGGGGGGGHGDGGAGYDGSYDGEGGVELEQSKVQVLSEPGVQVHFQPKRLSDHPHNKTAKLNNRGRSFVHLCEEFWENKGNAKNDNVCGE